MKYLAALVFAFIFLIPQGCKKEDKNIQLISSFLGELKQAQGNYSSISSKYTNLDTNKISTEERKFLASQLDILQKKITSSNNEGLFVKSYNELPSKEQNLILDKEEFANIYGVIFRDKQPTLVLVKDSKIASVLTMNKGGKRVFLMF